MMYQFNREHIQAMLRHIGLAVIIGSLFYVVLEEGELHVAIPFAIMGSIVALVGSLEKKHD
ncbi:MAG: hypothetical protein OXD47_05890 [Gammaproteobacteria bacterium]|nr:hypothetical protein [Gammaproteobacteria bacterium]MCY4338316.1 hypothetical protein [Gammaproteobacteria bacterium]